jgi:hypothetical protein
MNFLCPLMQYRPVPKQTISPRPAVYGRCRPASDCEKTTQRDSGRLEVNVVFTDPQATALALRTATALAAELDACIRLRATIIVPLQLPIDEPPISIPFMQSVLSELISRLEPHDLDVTAHLYLSRDRTKTFLEVLEPNSVVVVAARKRPWPTPESRFAKRLRRQGHRVLFIPWTKRDLSAVSASNGLSMPASSHPLDSFRRGAR